MNSMNLFRPTMKTLFKPTVPKQSTGAIVVAGGCLLLMIGGKYIANAINAGKKAANQAPLVDENGEPIRVVNHNLRYYEGGFEDPMDRREASLILGCRESACQEQIMDRYRTLIRINHPDLGGSAFITGKVNEAKTLLFSRARSDPEWLKSKKRREEREKRRQEREEQRNRKEVELER